VLPDVVAAVAGSLRLPYVAVTLADGSSVAHGTPTDRVEATPLTYAGEQVGQLVVGPGPGGLRRKDHRLLGELAGQAAVAVRTVLLTRELGRSREALVTAREEERRRLYRELHDGLGPSLAALALQVETARDLLAEDPGRASAVLDRVLPRLTGTVGDVRQVVTGLRPPALDDLGLDGALRELAGRFATASLQVSVHAAGLAGLPAAVEVAAYRIVAEALANAARHAQASQVQVHVERLADVVQVRVTDDGRGLGDTAPRGIGLPSMRARALELGGTFAAGARPAGAGTVVTARLPVGVHR
jgi:signal transduction histidine kinase